MTKSHLRFVFDLFNDLAEQSPDVFADNEYARVKTFAPIELVAVCALLSQYGDSRPVGALKGDIKALRDHLRSQHFDLRMNKECWTTAWNYIDDLELHQGTIDGSTIATTTSRATPSVSTTAKKQAVPALATKSTAQAREQPEDGIAFDTMNTPAKRAELSVTLPRRDALTRAPATQSPRSRAAEQLINYTADIEQNAAAIKRINAAPVSSNKNAASTHRAATPGSSSGDSIMEGTHARAAVMTVPAAKRRANLDFDINKAGANAQTLAAKKARLMGRSVKE